MDSFDRERQPYSTDGGSCACSSREGVFRAVLSITLALAVIALVAYVFGHLSRSDWVLWLPPLTVALEGTRFIRAELRDGAAILSSSADSIDADREASVYVASCAMATGMALWGVFAGNRLAILIGTALAVVGNTLDWRRAVGGARALMREPL